MKKHILKLTVALILAIFSIQVFIPALHTQQKTYKLSFCQEKGKTLKYKYNFNIKRIQERTGSPMKSENNSSTSAIISFSIEDVDKQGNILISMKFDSLDIHASNPLREYDADTTKSLSIPVFYKLNPKGEVIETRGLENLPEIPDFNTKGEYDLKSFLIQLPEKEVKINDTWTGEWVYNPTTSSTSQINTFITTYRLIGEVNKNGFGYLKIETITDEKIEGKQEYGGRVINLTGEAVLKGEIYFAYKEGIVVEESYVEEGGKLLMTLDSPQKITIINTNYARATFNLIQ